MEPRNAFFDCHPGVNALYFALVLTFSMCFMHPACLGISLAGAVSCSISLRGGRGTRATLGCLLPILLLTAAVNPAFSHRGATILTYLPSGNPLTLESLAYGGAAAAMLACAVVWFACCGAVMTSDKLVWLFGRVAPALSLVLSMTLGFAPRFRARMGAVVRARRCVGREVSAGGLLERAKNGVTVLSILITWSLESAIETADSMKSRGYGLPGRTAFSLYRLDRRDRRLLLWLVSCGAYILWGWGAGGLYWRYYPTLRGAAPGPLLLSLLPAYLALCLTPVLLNLSQARAWTAPEKGGGV